MKILICISQLTKGGAERVVSNLANYLSSNNEVTIAVLRKRKIEYEINNSVKIIDLENEETSKKNKVLKSIIRFTNLKKHFMNEKYDIVLCFLPEPSFMVLALKKKMNLKVVVSVRNDPKIEYKKILHKILMRLLYPKADGFVFQTEDAKMYFSEKIQKKSTVILNSLNPEFIVEKPFDGERKKEIISIGRLSTQKNHEMLIKAFKNVVERYSDYKLIIYGEGECRPKLEKLICDLNLKEKVFLPGIINEIKNAIYSSKLFILSSNYEGLPNALMEAMALGIPSISTDCPSGGPKTLINDSVNGFLINVNDVNELTNKVEMLLNNESLYEKISKESFLIKDRINPIKINKEWEEYLQMIINKTKRIK